MTAERALLRTGSRPDALAPVGALGEVAEGDDGPELWLRAVVAAPDGSSVVRLSAAGTTDRRRSAGRLPRARAADRRCGFPHAGARLVTVPGRAPTASDTNPRRRNGEAEHGEDRRSEAHRVAQPSSSRRPDRRRASPGAVAFVGTGPGRPRAAHGPRDELISAADVVITEVSPSTPACCRSPRDRLGDYVVVDGGYGEDGQPLTHASRAKLVVKHAQARRQRRTPDLRRPVDVRQRGRGGRGVREGAVSCSSSSPVSAR